MLRPLLVLLLTVPLFAAPKLQKEPLGHYLATRVGDQIVLETESTDGKSTVTQVIDKVEINDGTAVVTMIVNPEQVGQSRHVKFEASSKGTAWIFDRNKKDPVLSYFLKLPAKVGDEWTYEHRPGEKEKYTIKSVDEEVEVPAGKFKCIQVEIVRSMGGPEYKQLIWYAKNVGVVKGETTYSDKVSSTRLKSFKPGK